MNGVPMRRGAAPWLAWLAFLLAAAALLAAAGPAAAQMTTGTVTSPLFLGKSNLNGATVNVRTAGRLYTGSVTNTTFWSVSGAPSGATVTVNSVSSSVGSRNAGVTLAYTGDFTEDFTLTLEAGFSAFNSGDEETYTIPVLVNGTRRLVVGSVTGQPTEASGQATFTVALGTPISAAVSVSVSSQDSTEGTVSPSDLTFSTSNWATAQTVTVTGVNDDVDDGDVTWQVRLDPASDGGDSDYHALANVDVDVTTTDDNDTAGITVTPTTSTTSRLRTSEDGSTATFTVVLDSEPTGNVVLDVASSDTAQGTVDTDSTMNGLQSALTFTTSNWNTAQTVTLTGVDDSPGTADGSQTYDVTLTVDTANTADTTYGAFSAITVYAVNADDEYGLSVGSVTGQATEAGGQATFTVALATQPTAAVTVAVSSLDTGEGRVSPSSMTFTTSNWNVNQTVTVTGQNDSIHDGDVTWQVRLDPASGGSGGDSDYHGLANVDVDVTTTDDDALTAALSLSAASIAESGSSNTSAVSAVLSRPSSAATTLTVTAVSGAFTVPSGAAGRIEIAAGDTTTTSTVTITAVDNDTDAPNRTETVTATAVNDTGSGVASVTGATLTITDDDDPPDVTLSLSAATVSEMGGTSVVSAVLSRPSSAATTLTVTGVSGAFTVPSSAAAQRIVFAAGDTTSTDTVTVTAVDNTTDEPNRTPTVTATVANSQGTGTVNSLTLTLTDNDDAPTVTLTASPASISENEATSAISAVLSNPSSAVTTVTVTAAMGAAYTVPSSAAAQRIVFAAGATTSPDTVTVTSVDNDVDAADNAVTVTGTAANGHGVGTVTGASLTITDDDTAGLAVVPATSTSSRLRTTEAGGTATFTVALSSEPTGNVSVAVSSSDTAQGTVSAASLTFTASNWGTAQTVTLTGVDDNPGTTDGSQTYTVALTSSSTVDAAYNGIAQVTVYAINADDELGLDVGAVTGPATEAGGTATFTVALLTQPSESVTVAVSSRDASEGQVSPSSLTFSTSNWNVDQTVTVTGLNDDVDDGDVGWAVRLDPSSGDSDYNAAAVDVDVAVTTTDDDTAALTVSPTTSMTSRLRTTEAGGQATFTVRLATEPVGNVVLDVASARTTEGTVSPAMLTFTALNWDTAQTVTLTGANDDVDDGDQGYTATLTVNQTDTADTVYDALAAVTVYATNADDDTAGVTVSPETSTTSRLRTTEAGGTDTFTVVLATEPVGNVVLDVASSDLAQGTVDTDPVMNGLQSALTFTATNWNTAQTVTLTGVDDNPGLPDGSDDYTVTLTVNQTNTADPVYDAVSAVTVYARNLDDEAGVEVSPETSTTSRLRTKEDGRTATFTVVLLSKPEGADVTIPVASSDPSEGTVSPERLVFTPDNATTAQTVTVRGVDDDTDDGDRNYTIETGDPSSPDPTYDALGAGDVDDVFVVNEDDDGPPAVTLAVEPSSISEKGGETRVTATLSHPSSAATTVTVVSVSGAYTVGSDATVVIAAGETANPDDGVAITATDDAVDNDPDRTATVTGTASNAMGVGEVAGASLVLVDDDVARFVLSRSLVEVAACDAGADCSEGVYTAALASEPTGEVTVSIESDNEDVTVSAATLTFTPSNWDAAQTVTVTAAADGDSDADAAVLSHTARGGGYAGVSGRVAVAVSDPDGTRIVAPGPGESATYRAGGHLVTITVGAGVPPGVASGFVLPAPGGDLTVMLTAVRAEDLPLERGAFGFGEAAARTLVDIELSPVPAGGEEVCLGVSEALRDWAGDDDLLVLLRYADGAWGVAGESDFDASAMQVCATGVRSFSPFAVGFRNKSPRFEETGTFDAGSHVAGSTIEPLELPEARGGDGELTYTLVGPDGAALPEGHWLTFDADGKGEDGAGCPDGAARALCGMPPADMDDATLKFTLVVADRHGDEARLAVEIAIEENLAPTFGGATVPPQVYTLEEAIDPLLLPEATGGNPFVQGPRLRYALTPALPPGLDVDLDGTGACGAARTVCGTPEELAEEKLYTWTAEDRDGDLTMPPVRFTIEVEEGRAKGRARLKAINESILPELSRASWDSAMSAVSGRLETVGGGGGAGASGGGLATALAGFARANEQALEDDASWKEMLSGQSFAVALGGEGEGAAGTGLGRTVTVWGTGDRRRLSREVPSLEWSGDLSAFHLGADVGLDTGLTGGVGVSWYESRMDYVDRSEDEAIGGVHRSRMASVQPYMGWSWVDGSRLWASVGYGSGEVEIDDEDLVERFGRQKSDSELLAAAAGGAVRLVTAGAARVDLKGEGQVTRYEVDENGDLIAGLSVQTRRVRVSAEGSREYVLDGGVRLVPSAELGIRWDGGDGATGAGGEVGGGLSWSGPGRLEVEVAARWLVAHHSAVEEWGLSGGVRYEPRENGRGLSLRVAPVWGEAGSGVSRLWEDGVVVRGERVEERSGAGAALEAEVGYGVSAFEGFGVATPYTRFGLAQEERRYGLGWRLSRRSEEAFGLDLGVWRRERDTAPTDHGASLELRLNW